MKNIFTLMIKMKFKLKAVLAVIQREKVAVLTIGVTVWIHSLQINSWGRLTIKAIWYAVMQPSFSTRVFGVTEKNRFP